MFKYRIYPSLKQRIKLTRSCIAAKELWNAMRERRKTHYETTGETLGKYDIDKEFKGQHPELNAQARQNVSERLDFAFSAFFRRCKDPLIKKKGYPKFKKRCNSITYPQGPPKGGFKFESEKRLVVSKIGRVPIVLHRAPKGKVKTLTLKQDRAGDWWAILSCEVDVAEPPKHTGSEVGIDLGLLRFATTDKGVEIENPRWYRHAEERLKRLQRGVSRKKKGGANRRKARRLLARQHIKVANQRTDFHHKLALKVAKEHRFIAVEKLNIKGMLCNHHLAKSIADASWCGFLQKLEYKAVMAGSRYERVQAAGTTKRCSGCGAERDMPLSERTYRCEKCGLVLDRDHNAAINVLKVGRGTPEPNACGQRTSTAPEHSGAARPLEEAGTICDET